MGENTAIGNTLTGVHRRSAPVVAKRGPKSIPLSAGASLPQVQTQRGVRKIPLYKFKVPITESMRKTKVPERRKRHILVWQSIFNAEFSQFEIEFAKLYTHPLSQKKLDGLDNEYEPTDKHINYRLSKETYNKLDLPNKMSPLVADDSSVAEQLAIGVIENYQRILKKLTHEQGVIVDQKLKFIVERLGQDALDDDANTIDMLRLLDSAIEKTADLDDYGLVYLNGNALSYRKQFSNNVIYSSKNAKEFLERYHNVLDILLSDKHQRSKSLSGAIQSYYQAHRELTDKIPALRLLEQISALNKTLDLPSGGRPGDDNQIDWLKIQAEADKRIAEKQLNQFLKKTGYTKALIKTQRSAFAEAFKSLLALSLDQALTVSIRLVSFEITRQLNSKGLDISKSYFAQLYLDWASQGKQKKLALLSKQYPIIQFFDGDVFSLAKHVQGVPRFQVSPEGFFAADLDRLARRRLSDLLQARKSIRKENKRIWHLDKAVKDAFDSLGLAGTSYQWVVSTYASKEKNKGRWKRVLRDIVLFVISVVPVGRVIGTLVKLRVRTSHAAKVATALKVGVAGADIAQAKAMQEEIRTANVMKRVGLRTSSPSYVWVILAIAGGGFDLADLAKAAKISKSDVVKDLNTVPPKELSIHLKNKYDIRDDKLTRSIARKRLSADKLQQAFADFSKASGNRLASINAVANELSIIVFHMIKAGILEADVFINALRARRYFTKLTPGQMQELYEIHGEQLIRVLKTSVKIPKRISGKIEGSTVKWLVQNGLWTSKTARQFGSASDTIIDSLNTFRLSPGFDKVVADWLARGYKQDGARFVMRYALKNFKEPPQQIRFEVLKPRNPTLDAAGKTSGNPIRIRDVVVKFDSKPAAKSSNKTVSNSEPYEIKFEFKSIKAIRRNLVYRVENGAKVPGQLFKDLEELLMQLGPVTNGRVLKWVINGDKGLTKKQAFDQLLKYVNQTGLVNLPAWKKEGEAVLWSILEITN